MASPVRFIFSHSVFVSLCAAALASETSILAGSSSGLSVLLVFLSTLAAYNFYILAGRYFSSEKFILSRDGSHALMFLISAFLAVSLIFLLPDSIPWMLGASLLTLIYVLPRTRLLPLSALINKGFLKTLLLATTWTGVTLFVPVAGQGPHAMSVAAGLLPLRFCFMLILCILFDSRDVSVDAIKGLNSLATDLSRSRLHIVLHLVFVLYFISAAFMPGAMIKEAYWCTGVVTYFLFRLSLKNRGYYFYYFLVDGLMLFSALMIYLVTF